MELASPESRTGHGFESGDKSATPNAQHTRTYQACIPCRRRKVRCDLGPVDNPHDPPCVRCRREAKECFFSATRRKKRAADSGTGADDVDIDDYEVRGGRKRLKESEGGSDFGSYDAPPVLSPVYITQPLTPGGSLGRRQPLRRPDGPPSALGDAESEEQVNNHTAAMLQTAELHHGHDALNVLLAAAQHHPDPNIDSSKSSVPYDAYGASTVSPATAQHASPEMRTKPPRNPSSHNTGPNVIPTDEAEVASAIQAWSRFRFVRNGWFSAQEGMEYIDYFYSYLSPLTPIALPDYRRPSRHVALLEDEPLLAVTILMIASRYAFLKDNVGRSYALHQRLWAYTQRLIDRLLWGREMPGIYTSSLQGDAGCDVNPLSRKGLLTLGSVESLMLLTEWHSRYVHFPADEDDSELMAPEPSASSNNPATDKELRNKSVNSWIEPCFRSDRMCWKLLNMAMSVALEIGVFEKDSSRHAKAMPIDLAEIYEQRRLHVKSLLLVYITQTSGRLGVTAMLPEGYAAPSLSELFLPVPDVVKDIRDIVVHFWLQLARLVKVGNEKLYANRHLTREIIRNGEYKALLQQINPMLTKWRQQLDTYRSDIPPQMYHIMMIEYEHSRVCVNQLALQAVVERCVNSNVAEGNSGKAIPPDRLNQWYGDDRENVGTVIEACRNVLRIVVDGLAPGGFLKHVPVRTSFRMISVAMVLVKTFAFGANAKEMGISLNIMQRTVNALRENVVDDVHIANGFAHHIALLVERIPKALKRFPGSGQGNSRRVSATASRAVSQSPAPQSLYASRSADNGQSRDGSGLDQQWQFDGMAGDNNVHGQGQDPLGLDALDFGSNGDAFMLMPPPNNPQNPGVGHQSMSSTSDYGSYGGAYGANNFAYGQDSFDHGWMALPLDNIFGGQNVQQTGFGPTIDGDDMLDVLLGRDIQG